MTWGELRNLFVVADDIDAYTTGWVNDHLYNPWFPVSTESCNTFESFTAMAALAESTERLRIGSMVLGNLFRHPALVARAAATIDHVSNGRFELGIGAGWHEREHIDMGIDLMQPASRIAAWAEAVEVIHRLLTEEIVTFDGHYYQLVMARSEPKCIQAPRVPLVLGAAGEKLALRVVAQWADHWNFDGWDLARFRHKLGVLRQYCVDIGRDFSEIEVSVQVWSPGNNEPKFIVKKSDRLSKLARISSELEAAGADHLIVAITEADPEFLFDLANLVN